MCGEGALLTWTEAFMAGPQVAGGKGWNLGKLNKYGFNLPVGGILSSLVYKQFVQSNQVQGLIAEVSTTVSLSNLGSMEVEEKLAQLRSTINDGVFPPSFKKEIETTLSKMGILNKPLAIRSSATAEDSVEASFAGVHDSFLNIRGMDNIMTAIKRCYASLWTARALSYRRKMNIKDETVLPAVVIMEMVNANASGVAFSCDPQSGREEIISIEANFGLGESVVSGQVDPDRYTVDNSVALLKIGSKIIGQKEGLTVSLEKGKTEFVLSGDLSSQQVLSDNSIIKLGYLILRVFWALGNGEHHQDVEWVFDGKDFILVQARPITVMPRYTFKQLRTQPDIWSNANFRDAVPVVQSTLSWSSCWMLRRLIEAPFHELNYPLPEGIKLIRLYQGRLYLNMAAYQWGFFDAIGMEPSEMTASLGGHEPEIKIQEKKSLLKTMKRKMGMLRLVRQVSKAKKEAEGFFNLIRQKTRSLLEKDFASMDSKDFLTIFADLEEIACKYAPVYMMLALSGNYPNITVVNLLEEAVPGRGKAILNALMAGNAQITSADQGYRLVEMAQLARNDEMARIFFGDNYRPMLWEELLPDSSPFKVAFASYLEEFGHRGIYELDLINPRWRENPTYLLDIIRSTINTSDVNKLKDAQQQKRDKAWEDIYDKVPFYKRWMIRYWTGEVQKGAELREMAKSALVMLEEPLREVAKEMGRRLEGAGALESWEDVFYCSWSEITAFIMGLWDGKGLKELVSDRKELRAQLKNLSPPDFIVEDVPHFSEQVSYSPGRPFCGIGVSAGQARGIARLLYNPEELEILREGDVLVAPSTDPGWTPLFLKAAAIIMETGGQMSHGAIVAREYGIPAVVNIPGIMKTIKSGQEITVDGDEGKVYLMEWSDASV